MPPPLLSPYHMFLNEEEEAHMHALEQQLLQQQQQRQTGLPFSVVALGLDQCAHKNSLKIKTNIVMGLMQEAMAHPENPTLQVFALLRVLLPSRDSRSVFGFKTTSLIRSFAKAIEKEGGVSGKAASQQLLRTIKEPQLDETGPYFISIPEVAIARAHGKCFSSRGGSSSQNRLSLVEVAALCQRLTNTYKERHKQAVLTLTTRVGGKAAMSVHIDSVAEVLGSVLPRLSYVECLVLVKLLLRTVPIGIGPNTVMEALGPYLAGFLNVQQDLSRLAMAIIQQEGQMPGLVCGVPMTPMTCHSTSSPYMVKWLFTKQDTVKRYLIPKQGQVIMHSLGPWYVPTKSSGPTTSRNRFVDLESQGAIEMKTRRPHMLILREIRRCNPPIIQAEAAHGYLISYMLYVEEQTGDNVMLLQGARPLTSTSVEFVDASVVLDDPKQEEEEDYTPQKQKKTRRPTMTQRQKASIQEILKSMVLSTTGVQTPNGTVRVMWTGAQENNKTAENVPKGVMVQRKMDGDRMQAHIMKDSKGKTMVRLFTKRGRPVHMLYSDVAEELINVAKEQPCILDGEIVVVDPDTGKPLPWSSNKWRYDSGNGKTLSELIPSEKRGLVTLVGGTGSYGYNPDDQEDSLTFAPSAAALSQWSDLGASERERLKVKALPRGKLLFIVFDLLMWKGGSMVSTPCSQRLDKLKSISWLKKLKHTRIIEEAWYVKNAEELIQRLGYIVKEKGEGLILKNPEAPYEFTRSMHQRKLKICGPDINCGVVGLGFTQSRNPRLWGLLTCICSGDSAHLLVYNRVESLEGDKVRMAAEHILGLSSKVLLHEVLHNSSSAKPLQVGPYRVFVTSLQSLSIFSVTWLATGEERCTLYFMQGIPKDIQWLCNPFDCRFGLSQRGDVYPVDWSTAGGGGGEGQQEAAPPVILVPRFPVGRIQLDEHQRSEFDTPGSIEEKFKEAADEKTCIQDFIARKIKRLRTKPPHPKKLEELRRVLTAMEDPKETWPKVCPTTFFLKDISQMLKKQGHPELTAGERMVLSGIPKASQWDPLLIQQIPLLDMATVQGEDELGRYESQVSGLTQRMKQLKAKLNRTVLLPFTRTGTNLLTILGQAKEEHECFATVSQAMEEDEEEEDAHEEEEEGALCLDRAEGDDDEDDEQELPPSYVHQGYASGSFYGQEAIHQIRGDAYDGYDHVDAYDEIQEVENAGSYFRQAGRGNDTSAYYYSEEEEAKQRAPLYALPEMIPMGEEELYNPHDHEQRLDGDGGLYYENYPAEEAYFETIGM